MSFQEEERIKRVKMTRTLRDKKYTSEEIATYFGVSVSTVGKYIEDAEKFDAEGTCVVLKSEKKTPDLFSYSKTQIDMKDYFKELTLTEGFKCRVCKRYRKFEAGKKWDESNYVCIDCYATLSPEQISRHLS